LGLAACGDSSDSAGIASSSAASGQATEAVSRSTASVGGASASPNDSMIVSAEHLVDAAGNRWSVSGGVIARNGSAQTETQKVIVLLYDNGVIYQENIHCNWWSWTNGAWVATSPPASAGIPACPATALDVASGSLGVTVNVNSDVGATSLSGSMIISGARLVDSAGNGWTVSAGVIALNGSVQTETQQVAVLLYHDDVIYQENRQCMWWSWTNGAWVASAKPAASGIPSCGTLTGGTTGTGGTSGSGGTTGSGASANGSMIPSVAQLTDSAGNTWSVKGGVIAMNGAAQTITQQVIAVLYYNGVIYQENSHCGWWSWTGGTWVASTQPAAAGIPACSAGVSTVSSSSSSSGGSGSSGSSAGVPAAAAAVGFNTSTFGPAVTLNSTWRPFTFYGSGAQPAGYANQNADGSLYLSGTGHSSGTGVATASQTNTGKNWSGIAFGGGGYFEAVLSFTGQGNGPYNNGGPGFWALDIEHTSQGPYTVSWPGQPNDSNGNPYDDFFEVDFMEYDAGTYAYQNGIGNWYGYPPTKATSNPHQEVGGSAGSVLVPSGTNFAQYHSYGCLWMPATPSTQGYLKFYFDGVQLGDTFYWNYNNPNNPFPPLPQNNSTAMSGMDGRHLFLILGTGTDQPMTVKSVTVWQASGANNLTE
jgi:hypothetical protein